MLEKWKTTMNQTAEGWRYMVAQCRELGLSGVGRAIYRDMFVGRSPLAWAYLIALTLAPLVLELVYNGRVADWLGMLGAITGVLTVVLVSEGRASNYFWGLINSLIYLYLTIGSGFFGEVATTVYFTIMQPIGLFVWLNASRFKREEQDFVAKRLSLAGWIKYLVITLVWWGIFGLAYQSIGSKRPFRDSVTDGTNGVGQLLMNGVYAEQWLFWAATNIFSIYLWWGESLQMQGMYWLYLVNCLVGAYQWFKQAKR